MATSVNNIFLVGFIGAGTSSVGALLAKKLDWRFLDTEQMVMKVVGNSIAKYLELEGEAAFRSAEEKQVNMASTGKHTVVALGAASLQDRDTRERVLRSGMVVFLEASVDTLMARAGGVARPFLRPMKGKTLRQTIEETLASRKYVYSQAHLTVSTDGKTPEAVMLEIIKLAETWTG